MQPTSNKALGRTVSNLQKKVIKMQEQLNEKQDKKINLTKRVNALERKLDKKQDKFVIKLRRRAPKNYLMTLSEARKMLKRMPFLSEPKKVA